MTVTLYRPGHEPEVIADDVYRAHHETGDIGQNAVRAGELLGCDPGLVDVLACGTGYLVYSVFDYEGDTNIAAMAAVAEVGGLELDPTNDDEVLQGPVLVVLR